jgi:hypothetical protein
MLRHRLACLVLWAAVTTPVWAQVAPADSASVTVGELMARVRERCEAGRAALGPFQMKVQIERPAAAEVAPTTAVLLVMDDKVLAIMSGGTTNGILKILDDGTAVHCNPAGAMSDDEIRDTLTSLTFSFDCDQLADPLGLGAGAVVAVEESEGATYYRVDAPVNALRWIDAEDLTLAEEWIGDDGRAIREVYNNWAPMGGGAWYPELMEQWTDDVVTTRLKVVDFFPAPDLSPGVFTVENFTSTWTFDDVLNDAETQDDGEDESADSTE